MTNPVPYDEHDEAQAVACAVFSRHGALLAAERMSVDDLYVPALARLYRAALRCPHDVCDEWAWTIGNPDNDRAAWCSEIAGVPLGEVWALLGARSVQIDVLGRYARRVRRAADRRRALRLLADAYERVMDDDGVDIDEVLSGLA